MDFQEHVAGVESKSCGGVRGTVIQELIDILVGKLRSGALAGCKGTECD